MAPSINKDLKPLLLAEGFSTIWNRHQVLYTVGDSWWAFRFYEAPTPIFDRACYLKEHAIDVRWKHDHFVVQRDVAFDLLRISLVDCSAIYDPDSVAIVDLDQKKYGYPSSQEIEGMVRLLYLILAKDNKSKLVVDQISPGLEKPFTNLRPQDLVRIQLYTPGIVHAHFFNKVLFKDNQFIDVAIKKPVDEMVHIEVGWVQYDVLE